MNTSHLDELIDDFLQGKLSAADKIVLEAMVAADPSAAAQLRESRAAYALLEHVRNEKLREVLIAFDKKHHNRLRKMIIGKCMLVMMVVFLFGFLTLRFFHSQPHRFVQEFLVNIPEEGTDSEQWSRAMLLFRNKQYDNAQKVFEEIAIGQSNTKSPAAFNALLCRLVNEGPTPSWNTAFNTYAGTAHTNEKATCERLRKKLASPFYRFSLWRATRPIGSIRPQII